jgi:uncharacterized membrane protein YbaN (DUF454 family)
MRHTILLILGWVLVVLGVLGLVLPLLQGLLFLAVGLYLLSFEQPWVRRQRAELERRFPKVAEKLNQGESKARDLYRRVTGRDPEEGGGGRRR